MRERAAAVEATRRRILEATSACHREQGIGATGIEDVARRAGVAVGTVYRHFPTLDQLVDTCGAVFMERFALPEPDQAPAIFRGLRTREERLGRLVDEIAARYRAAAIGFVRAREAKDDFAATAAAHRRIEDALDALTAEAVRPLRYSPTRRQTLRALLDARVWQALADQQLQPDTIQQILRTLALAT